MKRQTKYIIICCVSLVFLLGLLFVVSKLPEKTDKDKVSSNEEQVSLISVDKDSIKSINVKNSSGEYNIRVEESDDIKSYAIDELNDDSKVLSKTNIESVFTIVSMLSAKREVEKNSEDLEKFGIEDSSPSIKIEFSDGTEKFMQLGSQAPLNAGYYLKFDDTVYLVEAKNSKPFLNSMSYYQEDKKDDHE